MTELSRNTSPGRCNTSFSDRSVIKSDVFRAVNDIDMAGVDYNVSTETTGATLRKYRNSLAGK